MQLLGVSMNNTRFYFVLLTIFLSACGQKGPLYLPQETVQDIQSEKITSAESNRDQE